MYFWTVKQVNPKRCLLITRPSKHQLFPPLIHTTFLMKYKPKGMNR